MEDDLLRFDFESHDDSVLANIANKQKNIDSTYVKPTNTQLTEADQLNTKLDELKFNIQQPVSSVVQVGGPTKAGETILNNSNKSESHSLAIHNLWDDEDVDNVNLALELGSLATSIAGTVASFVPGGGQVAGMGADLASGLMEGAVHLRDGNYRNAIKSFGFSLGAAGMSLLGAAGTPAKLANITRKLSTMPRVLKYLVRYGLPAVGIGGAVADGLIDRIVQGEATFDDLKTVLNAITMGVGAWHAQGNHQANTSIRESITGNTSNGNVNGQTISDIRVRLRGKDGNDVFASMPKSDYEKMKTEGMSLDANWNDRLNAANEYAKKTFKDFSKKYQGFAEPPMAEYGLKDEKYLTLKNNLWKDKEAEMVNLATGNVRVQTTMYDSPRTTTKKNLLNEQFDQNVTDKLVVNTKTEPRSRTVNSNKINAKDIKWDGTNLVTTDKGLYIDLIDKMGNSKRTKIENISGIDLSKTNFIDDKQIVDFDGGGIYDIESKEQYDRIKNLLSKYINKNQLGNIITLRKPKLYDPNSVDQFGVSELQVPGLSYNTQYNPTKESVDYLASLSNKMQPFEYDGMPNNLYSSKLSFDPLSYKTNYTPTKLGPDVQITAPNDGVFKGLNNVDYLTKTTINDDYSTDTQIASNPKTYSSDQFGIPAVQEYGQKGGTGIYETFKETYPILSALDANRRNNILAEKAKDRYRFHETTPFLKSTQSGSALPQLQLAYNKASEIQKAASRLQNADLDRVIMAQSKLYTDSANALAEGEQAFINNHLANTKNAINVNDENRHAIWENNISNTAKRDQLHNLFADIDFKNANKNSQNIQDAINSSVNKAIANRDEKAQFLTDEARMAREANELEMQKMYEKAQRAKIDEFKNYNPDLATASDEDVIKIIMGNNINYNYPEGFTNKEQYAQNFAKTIGLDNDLNYKFNEDYYNFVASRSGSVRQLMKMRDRYSNAYTANLNQNNYNWNKKE